MKLLEGISFIANILLLLAVNIYLWSLSWICGVGGMLGIIGFFIGYSISDGMVIAPRDYWRLPTFELFKKKLAYGNAIAGSATVIASFILYVIIQVV